MLATVSYGSVDLYLPSLPAITQAFHISAGLSQLTVSIFLLSFCSSQLVYGPFSDYFGRKLTLFIGLSIYIIGCILCFVSPNIACLLGGRFVQGLGSGAAATLARVIPRDIFRYKTLARVMSILNAGLIAALMIAPVLGGFIQQKWNFKGNFFVMLIAGLFLFVSIFFFQETHHEKNHSFSAKKLAQSYLNLLKHKTFIAYIIISSMAMSAITVIAIFNPFLLQNHFGLTAAQYGLLTLVIAGSEFLAASSNSFLLEKFSSQRILFWGISFVVFSGLSMWLTGIYWQSSVLIIIITSAFSALGLGLIACNTSAQAFSLLDSDLGAAGAIYGFVQMIIVTVVSAIASRVPTNSQVNLAILLMILGLIAFKAYRRISHIN